ncbi:NAD(P)H-quinone oxidoreductase [Pokkaliibacter sp. MBI-7]|uniref:NAD(P)H-quinone oxidoreductase n=1 Tax=Pokkaliibacter sp. MBI-7 TaxID=3040600 RepID=UPI00244A679C|nr:NAD(P)H-quinone oxidoreductase [Pokkaliibacter sp. MBI-7]MDH2435050.1 NAD(P)H-quinone oxidoreductase [Pokkaliibacter sp. MBI-7]
MTDNHNSSNLPEQMTAIAIREFGGPDVLVPTQRSLPSPDAGEVLIKVKVAGVNRPDVMQRKGGYAPPPGASDLPGLEIAGEVVALGTGVSRYQLGDQVCALVAGGGYAEYCTVHESNALPVPQGYSLTEAAALPETFFTVWTNVFQSGELKSGETLLVHGGSSGIGTTAIMLGKAFGARVIVTVGSDDKAASCIALGADAAINYKTQDFVEEVKQLTGGAGADVILDMVGGDYVPRNYQVAAKFGRIVQIATQHGAVERLNLLPLMVKRLIHTGSTLRPRSVAEKAEIAVELEEKVWPLLNRGEIRPQIFKCFALNDASKAHALMESSSHTGKIMLLVDSEH